MTSISTTPTVPSFDPQLLKLLAHQRQFSAKEYLQHAYFYNHPPPNTVATNLPRHLLGNGLSKLNTEKRVDPSFIDAPKKNFTIPPPKDSPSTFDQWLQPPPGSVIQGPLCLPSDSCSSTDLKSETILSSGKRSRKKTFFTQLKRDRTRDVSRLFSFLFFVPVKYVSRLFD